MSVEAKAVVGIGLTFDNGRLAGEWFIENFKGTLTDRERRLLDESFSEFFEAATRKDFPEGECLNCYSGDGFALYYPLKAKTAPELRLAVDKAVAAWETQFRDAPEFISDVQWF